VSVAGLRGSSLVKAQALKLTGNDPQLECVEISAVEILLQKMLFLKKEISFKKSDLRLLDKKFRIAKVTFFSFFFFFFFFQMEEILDIP